MKNTKIIENIKAIQYSLKIDDNLPKNALMNLTRPQNYL
jgi:hypothetical protein